MIKRLFKVHDGAPEEYAELIVAENKRQAQVIALHVTDLGGHRDVNLEDLIVSEVQTYSGSDKQVPQEAIDKLEYGDQHIGRSPEESAMLRDLGWECDGDQKCVCCGLAELDGMFPVCEECEQCSECGHEEECPEKEKI